MHAQHTQIVRVICIHRAKAFQRTNHRHMRCGNKLTQRWNCLRHPYATTYVQYGFLCLRQHLAGLFNLSM
ncbi:hypothetical protein D3C73_1422030 [compost metagenome]